MSEPLFRFILTRPPAQPDLQTPSVNLTQQSDFQGALAQAAKNDNPIQALRSVAIEYLTTSLFIGDPAKTPLAAGLDTLSIAFESLQLKSSLSVADLIKAVKDSFGGEDPGAVVKSPEYTNSLSRLRDSILAIKQLQEEHSRPIEALANQLRDLDLIANLAKTDPVDAPTAGNQLLILRRRPLQFDLPTLKSIVSDSTLIAGAQDAANKAEAAKKAQIQALVNDVSSYRAALSELTKIDSSHIVSMAQLEFSGSPAHSELLPTTGLLRQANMVAKLSDISLKYLDPSTPNPPRVTATTDGVIPSPDPNALAAVSHFTDAILKAPSFFLTFSPAFKPVDRGAIALKLTPEKIMSLSEVTTGVLQTEGISLSTMGLDRAVTRIRGTLSAKVESLNKTAIPGLGDNVALKTIGGTTVAIRTPRSSPWSEIVIGGEFWPGISQLTDNRIPQTHGNVAPAGVADLLVVRQQLKSYEGADLSSIENVLKSEKRDREHTTTRTTTSVTTTQTETTDQETRDLESTSRFEMSKEAENTIKTDQSLKAGLNISASYGPTVSLSASVEGSTSKSQTEATKAASKFSQDITEKSSKSITTRVLQSTSLTITDQVVEKDVHSFDNTAGTGNISGVYQWVTKVYEAQIFNYGLRVMYDFMIPEPAAFFIEVFKQAQAQAVKLDRPGDLTITAQQINESTYPYWVALYGATDVVAPPDDFKSYAKEMNMPYSSDSNQEFNKTDEITIDAGYQALSCTITCGFTMWDNSVDLTVGVGTVINRFSNGGSFFFQSSMNDENGSIPVWMKTYKAPQAVVGIEVKCVRTDRAYAQWQVDTFGKIWNAHKARLQEYNEALAQLQLNAGVAITGKDPATNLVTMRNELKKNCISILTDQHYDMFNAIDTSSGLPQIDIYQNEAEGSYVRFFEQAFEWEEMTWLTYPYYWGRKTQWPSRIAFSDPDPAFEDFLKAGYCRAVAPVRPGFETAIDHFLKYGELWNGGPLPPISDGLYVPIANEIAERLGKPGKEIPQGDPWEVRIPTTLIKLRKDDSLPKWTKQPDGTWKSNDS